MGQGTPALPRAGARLPPARAPRRNSQPRGAKISWQQAENTLQVEDPQLPPWDIRQEMLCRRRDCPCPCPCPCQQRLWVPLQPCSAPGQNTETQSNSRAAGLTQGSEELPEPAPALRGLRDPQGTGSSLFPRDQREFQQEECPAVISITSRACQSPCELSLRGLLCFTVVPRLSPRPGSCQPALVTFLLPVPGGKAGSQPAPTPCPEAPSSLHGHEEVNCQQSLRTINPSNPFSPAG